MNALNDQETKKLARAIYDWRQTYQAMETSPEVEKARLKVENAQKSLIETERLFREDLEKQEVVIKELTTLVESSVTAFGIRAEFRKAYDRITYDQKTLDRIAEENTRIKNLIFPHRKVTAIASGVSVKIADAIALMKPVKFSPVLEIK